MKFRFCRLIFTMITRILDTFLFGLNMCLETTLFNGYVKILVIPGLPLKEAQRSPVWWELTWRIFFCHECDQAAQPYQHYLQYQ